VTIALGLLWVGYSVSYYGWNRITGGNNTFVSLVWPGRYSPVARDDGSGGATSTASTTTAATTKTNTSTAPGGGQTVPGKRVQPS
jgi:hypothetical protein